jgi:hypothetical protein
MATLVTIIVDTDAAYSGYDYTSLETAQSTEAKDITAGTGTDEYFVFECYATSGTNDTTAVVMSASWSVASANYVEFNGLNDSNYGHRGQWDDNEYTLEVSNSACIRNQYLGFFRIIGLQLKLTLVSASRFPINDDENSETNGVKYYTHNIIRADNNATYATRGIDLLGGSSAVAHVHNNLIYDIDNSTTSVGIFDNIATAYIYNNTVIGGNYGVYRNGGSAEVDNNLFQDQDTNGHGSTGNPLSGWGYNVNNDSTLNISSASGTSNDLKTGTATAYTADKLRDSGGGLDVAVVGSIVVNTTDSTYAYVTVVDSGIELTLSADIFDNGNEGYRISSNIYGTPDFQTGTDNYLLDNTDTVAMFRGQNLYADANSPVTDDILLNSRGSSSTDNFDIGAHHSLEYNRIVDPDSGPGTDYTSLSSWESNEQADLQVSGLNKISRADCTSSSGTADSTAVSVVGWTTTADNYINIVGDTLTQTSIDTSKYRIEITDDGCFSFREDYVRIDSLQFKMTYSTSDTYEICVDASEQTATTNDLRISNCILACVPGATVKYNGINCSDADVNIKIWNTIIYDFPRRGIQHNGSDCEIFNCTIEGATSVDGIFANSGDIVIKNCAVWNCSDDIDVAAANSSTLDTNATDDGDGDNPITPSNWANVFEDWLNHDYRLKSTDTDLKDKGLSDPGSGLFSDDIFGTERPQ